MSGWWVLVDSRTPEERDASQEKEPGAVLASWDAGTMNMRFLDQLVSAGRATQLKFNGYPNRYVVTAADFVPFIIDGPPVVTWGPNREENYRVTIDRDKLLALPAEHILTVDVWDQS